MKSVGLCWKCKSKKSQIFPSSSENVAPTHLLLPIRHVCPLSKLQLLGSKHADLHLVANLRKYLPNISVTIVWNKSPVGWPAVELVSVESRFTRKSGPCNLWDYDNSTNRAQIQYKLVWYIQCNIVHTV